MASNDALIKQANALAEQLETPVETDGLNNAALVSLVGNLRTGLAVVAADADAVVAEVVDAVAAVVEPAGDPPPFVVAPGTSITKMGGGIIGPGEEIHDGNLSGGQDAIDAFVKAGKIVKG